MTSTRKLALSREALVELSTLEIESVAGANVSGLLCEVTRTLCFPTCGPMCTGTSSVRIGKNH